MMRVMLRRNSRLRGSFLVSWSSMLADGGALSPALLQKRPRAIVRRPVLLHGSHRHAAG
jgi:hypothetical protein